MSSNNNSENAERIFAAQIESAKERDAESILRSGTQAIIDMGVDAAWENHVKDKQPLLREAWLGIIAHLGAKPFTKVMSTGEYEPSHLNDWLEDMFDDTVKQPQRRMSFHDYSRSRYYAQGLAWHFESLENINGESALVRTEIFVPESAHDLEHETELSRALGSLGMAQKLDSPDFTSVLKKPHAVLGIQSTRQGRRKHAVNHADLSYTVQKGVLDNADTILFNVKSKILGQASGASDMWALKDEVAFGQLYVQDISGDAIKPRIGHSDIPLGSDVYAMAMEAAEEELTTVDSNTPQQIVALLSRSH